MKNTLISRYQSALRLRFYIRKYYNRNEATLRLKIYFKSADKYASLKNKGLQNCRGLKIKVEKIAAQPLHSPNFLCEPFLLATSLAALLMYAFWSRYCPFSTVFINLRKISIGRNCTTSMINCYCLESP